MKKMTAMEVKMLDSFEMGVEDGFTQGEKSEASAELPAPLDYAYNRGYEFGVRLASEELQ